MARKDLAVDSSLTFSKVQTLCLCSRGGMTPMKELPHSYILRWADRVKAKSKQSRCALLSTCQPVENLQVGTLACVSGRFKTIRRLVVVLYSMQLSFVTMLGCLVVGNACWCTMSALC